MLLIPGYQLLQKIDETINSEVYRALRESDELPVILKALKTEYPLLAKQNQYRHEYDLLVRLNLSGTIRAYALEYVRNLPVLVLEDFNANSLRKLLQQQKLSLIEKLEIAILIAEAVGELHAKNIIHKDLNPANIIYNPHNQRLKLIDFGIACQVSHETPTHRLPDRLEGTLAYISPEQTGRMDREIDYRSDFYALGVSLYELFTGQLPFDTHDSMELIHCHLAKQATPPHELKPEIPVAVSQLIMKLLNKVAEERYQSAWGLRTDLADCLQHVQTKGNVLDTLNSRHKVSNQFQIPPLLYGRKTELDSLQRDFERVFHSETALLVLIAGEAGVGKTALIQHFQRRIRTQACYLCGGSFEQLQPAIPYSALLNALRELIQSVLMESQSQLQQWQQRLINTFPNSLPQLVAILPELKSLLPEHYLTGGEVITQHTYLNKLFVSLIQTFAQVDKPLVIFLDNLQWADQATLKLLLPLIENIPHLLLIGTYRNQEVNTYHSLHQVLETARNTQLPLKTLFLTPLSISYVNQFIADSVNTLSSNSLSLAQVVMAKTDGNPFFMIEFLQTLFHEHILFFDEHAGIWHWDLERAKTCDITANVVELLADKIQKQPIRIQHLLKLAACIGVQFSLYDLIQLSEKNVTRVETALQQAVQAGLLLPLNNHPTYNEQQELFRFTHNRIQQAAYSLNSETEQYSTHQRIGQYLLKNTTAENRQHLIFEIVKHLNKGIPCLSYMAEYKELAELNVLAGQTAMATATFDVAISHFTMAKSLLGNDGWTLHYSLMLSTIDKLFNAYYAQGYWHELETQIKETLPHINKHIEKVNLYELWIRLLIAKKKYREAIRLALNVCQKLWIKIPLHPKPYTQKVSLLKTRVLLFTKPIKQLEHLPEMKAGRARAAMQILTCILSATFFSHPRLAPLIMLKQVRLSLRHGNTPASSHSYACYGLFLCGYLHDIRHGQQFGQAALAVAKRFSAYPVFKIRTQYLVYTFIDPWTHALRDLLAGLQSLSQQAREVGELEYAAHSICSYTHYAWLTGCELSSLAQEVEQYQATLHNLHQEAIWENQAILQQTIVNLTHATAHPWELRGEYYQDLTQLPHHIEKKEWSSLFLFYFFRLLLNFWFNRYPQALADAQQAEKYHGLIKASACFPVFRFYYTLTQLALLDELSTRERQQALVEILNARELFQTWNLYAPENHQHRLHLLDAELARVQQKNIQARYHYEEAIRYAHRHGYIQEEAVAWELAARFYLQHQHEVMTRFCLQHARHCYQGWGAKTKVLMLEQHYNRWLNTNTLPSGYDFNTLASISHSNYLDSLDLVTVVRASQALASEIVLEQLLAKLMHIVIENAGAERGFLILEKNGQWVIEAQGYADNHQIQVSQTNSPQQELVLAESCLPMAIIHYVARTHGHVVLADASSEGAFTHDAYIQTTRPKSVLCMPLLHQGKLNGLLYLENNLASGLFTQRLEVLELLSAQAAISIENAQLYRNLQRFNHNLEELVDIRTEELSGLVERLESTTQQAEAANRAKSAFLANMSHELRTPLNAILGFAQLMQRDINNTDIQQENLSIILHSGEHLLELINDVLEMSKIEAGQTELIESTFNLLNMLNHLREMLLIKTREKGLQLHFEYLGELPEYIKTDERKLTQILLNLLGNAIKFTLKGEVRLQVQSVIANGSEQCQLQFSVHDTGVGIAEEELPSLFEAFQQASSRHATLEEGTGLGLTISRQFVHMMGGEIEVSSQVGQGSCFRFYIWVLRSNVQALSLEHHSQRVLHLAPDTPKTRLLVVEDREENRLLMRRLLSTVGFEVLEAEHGAEAIQRCRTHMPDLIWMDMLMPVMDGYEATQKIRALPNGQHVPIIALTASVFERDKQAVLAAGCSDFVGKPFTADAIFEKIAQHLSVSYVYERDKTLNTVQEADPPVRLTRENLLTLPRELRTQLYYAVACADTEQVLHHLQPVTEQYPEVVQAIRRLVQDFCFEHLLALLQEDMAQ